MNLGEEIKKGVVLKKVEINTKDDSRPNKINKSESNSLQNNLSEAIKMRRMELTKFDIENSESEDDWSD